MAEGWTRHLKGDLIEAYSAGVDRHDVDPLAVQVMAEVGVDIDGQNAKSVKDVRGIPFDYVITVCETGRQRCPLFLLRAKVLHVGFEDPPRLAFHAKTREEAIAHYRRIRDEIHAFVLRLPEALVPETTKPKAS